MPNDVNADIVMYVTLLGNMQWRVKGNDSPLLLTKVKSQGVTMSSLPLPYGRLQGCGVWVHVPLYLKLE